MTQTKLFKESIYLAGPFFNEKEVQKIKDVKKILEDAKYKVFSPMHECHLPPKASLKDRQKVFKQNIRAIKYSDKIVAITDGKDTGTMFEIGYSYAVGTPIVFLATELKGKKFNLMLAQAGIKVLQSLEELKEWVINPTYENYIGDIE
jgi:nucleoside 2-deoxyribosyltransferase|tara:strand:- start:6041 stop:6484 length:444 start_codon:yes stop_codon:yes gene_type:complete